MKLANIVVNEEIHLAKVVEDRVFDLGKSITMMDVIKNNRPLPENGREVQNPVFANVINPVGKIICVGLNYAKHAKGIQMDLPKVPLLFSKYADALVPDQAEVTLFPWETTYDYEGELVIVVGKEGWDVKKEDAMDYVFGYSVGNDLSCRDAQLRTSQWLIGKSMPAFGPCGPYIVTKDEYDYRNKTIRSYVNGEMRQDGNTEQMIFKVEDIISHASRYLKLNPGDLIYTGTPSGVALEQRVDKRRYLEKGDVVTIEIEGIGTLTNKMVQKEFL